MADLFTGATVVRDVGSVVLYGAGQVGHDVCRVLTAQGIRVVCMLDRRATTGESYLGVPMSTVDACPIDFARRSEIPIVLTIFNRDVDIPALARTMPSLGFTRVVSFLDLHALFPEALGDRFWLTDRGYVDAHQREIDAADRLWADEASRACYRGFIELRRSGRFDDRLNPRPEDRQYLPADIPGWLQHGPHRVVDCGAFQGDTLELMLSSNVAIETSAHFEPAFSTFVALAQHVRDLRHRISGPVLLWPCALSDRSRTVGFRDGLGEASAVSVDGDSHVPAVALDDVLTGWRPTLIKMDIEGSEVAALSGARRLIAESRPSLAISAYHRPDDLWRIPLMLASWQELGGYRYYLRPHGFSGFDTVVYAVPPEGPQPGPSSEVRS